jgi:hypothetical protein
MNHDPTTYRNLAAAIADPAIQSRIGFGAFGKYSTLFERTHRLITKSSLLAPPNGAPYWSIDPDFLHFAMRHGQFHHAHFIRHLMTPDVYYPQCIWALFWALAKAEHNFAIRFLPFWSHEERLTGHFISQLCERISEFECRWADLDSSETKKSWLDVWYADTATGNREKETGADLGLIINGQYAGDREFFKAARFQVKKVPSNNTAIIDLDQTQALLRTENLGYYLFYHAQDRNEWRRPPSVAPAHEFANHVRTAEEAIKEGKRLPKNQELGTQSVNNVDSESYDFAAFLTFALADPGSECGVMTQSKNESVRVLMNGGPGGPPSRVIVISLGKPIDRPEWLHALGEYVRIPKGENE